MNTADRRAEIISILMVRRRITAKELAEEFNVTIRTIQMIFRLYLLVFQSIQDREEMVGFLLGIITNHI